ncbi:glutamate ligase domain-containing protein [Deinococcus maricopensis]|uniref:tetrahydrofolate synthase n=1 Tax=Deinococcus maricopensis (strain DSM 21211 / LMG 22137 / NRRL B-23946 / LB-34) TaxID=709986 RepID=E8U3V8_DEIML|nr:cyanophycin synthetase [Deinococcus maricopensis]ADV68801.1 FolC bifunctional protein [Deinococcus maricopensis DSM 21211]
MTGVYDWLYAQTRAGRDRDPATARALLDALGAPDQHFPNLRVVGTNGKGSVSAMLDAGLTAAGLRTGRFTSPHLTHFEERVRVNGQPVHPDRTATFVRWAQHHAPDAAFFDLTLALAAQAFAQDHVDLAIMEAGVGGERDATHALHGVRAVLLTNVALDHTATLGPTIPQIAREKARAAQRGVPLLTTATGEALNVIQAVATDIGAPLYTPATHPHLFHVPHPPRLRGPHQHTNAALALAALRHLGHETGVPAALNAEHPGRLEEFHVHGRTVLLDGAHNPHAAHALATAVPHADVLLFAALARKDAAATLAPLLNVAPTRVFTAPPEGGSDPHPLARQHGGHAHPDPHHALGHALTLTPPGGTLIVAGSLHLAGHLRPHLLDMAERSPYTP